MSTLTTRPTRCSPLHRPADVGCARSARRPANAQPVTVRLSYSSPALTVQSSIWTWYCCHYQITVLFRAIYLLSVCRVLSLSPNWFAAGISLIAVLLSMHFRPVHSVEMLITTRIIMSACDLFSLYATTPCDVVDRFVPQHRIRCADEFLQLLENKVDIVRISERTPPGLPRLVSLAQTAL